MRINPRTLLLAFALFASVRITADDCKENYAYVIFHGAPARGWTICTFPGHHVAHVEHPRGVATLMETAVGDQNEAHTAKPADPVAK
jgi:hypothetical protein